MTFPAALFAGVAGWSVFAQTTGGDSGGISIAALVAQLGLSGVFLFLYQQERKERIRVQDANSDLAKTAYPLLTVVSESLKNVNAALAQTAVRMTQAPDETQHGVEAAMRAVAQELKASRENRRGPIQ